MLVEGIRVTKLDAAHRQFKMAVWLFFCEGDPVCIQSLAGNARELYERQCSNAQKEDLLTALCKSFPTHSRKDLINVLHTARNYIKHDNSLGDPPNIILTEMENLLTIFAAAMDCTSLMAEDTLPEAVVYLCWHAYTYPQLACAIDLTAEVEKKWPGLTTATSSEKRKFGRALLKENGVAHIDGFFKALQLFAEPPLPAVQHTGSL